MGENHHRLKEDYYYASHRVIPQKRNACVEIWGLWKLTSNINSWEQGLQRENTENEIEGDESSYADKRLVNERDINCRCFSDNEPQKNSEKDSSTTKRIKSESDVDIDEELAEQKLLLDETSTWIDIKQTKNETRNGCETCNRFCNGEKDNRVVCTAL